MSNLPLGGLVLLNLDVIYAEPNHQRSACSIIHKTKNNNCQPQSTMLRTRPGSGPSPNSYLFKWRPNCLLSPPLYPKIFPSPPCAPGKCVRIVYAIKTNRHPSATARKMDVGFDKLRDEEKNKDGVERRRDRGRNSMNQTERKKKGWRGTLQRGRVKVVIKEK